MDYHRIKFLINKKEELEVSLEEIMKYVDNPPLEQKFIIFFTEKHNETVPTSTFMNTPMGKMPCTINVIEPTFDGSLECKISNSSMFRICNIIASDIKIDLSKINKELSKYIKK